MEENIFMTQNNVSGKKQNKKKNKYLKFFLIFLSTLVSLCLIVGVLGFFLVYVPGKGLVAQLKDTQSNVNALKQSISDKDLEQAKIQISELKIKIDSIQKSFNKFSYAKSLPYAKEYFNDAQNGFKIAKDGLETGEILIAAIEPYKDFLGLKGASTDSAKTTEDRIDFLANSIEGLVPHMDTIEKKIADIKIALNEIDPNRYPEEFRGYQIKSNILKAQETIESVHKFTKDGKPILTKTSWLLGKDKPRTYLMIFQNNAELRATGGFWTAFGVIKVDKGKINQVMSDDIYSLDAKINSTIPAPRPIKAYHINVPYLNVRDMNLSPDFPTGAATFLEYYYKAYGKKNGDIDAVIAVDLKVLTDLVAAIGRVGVSGYGNFSADPDKRCDGCPQIVYQLEYIADKPKNYIDNDRKGFLGPLMNSLLSNAMGAEKSKLTPLMEAMIKDINEKHILFYFDNKEIQEAAELANIAGKINAVDTNIDYLHLNDVNFGSAKSNIFVKQKIKHEIISKDGKVDHKLTITYTNPSKASNCNLEKGDLCLNAPKYRNWFRFYVPIGSKLNEIKGSEVEAVQYEELGKQVFEGFYGNKFPLYAQSSLKTSIQYTSSVPASSNYTLVLQKQPGTKEVPYELVVNGKKQDTFNWVADKTIKLSL